MASDFSAIFTFAGIRTSYLAHTAGCSFVLDDDTPWKKENTKHSKIPQ